MIVSKADPQKLQKILLSALTYSTVVKNSIEEPLQTLHQYLWLLTIDLYLQAGYNAKLFDQF